MKANSAGKPGRFRVALISCSVVALLAGPAAAASNLTDIANIPLANASSSSALPNVYFILDDSGSMKRDFMPDGLAYPDQVGVAAYQTTNANKFYNSYCNYVYYNPNYTYPLPVKSDGTTYPNSSWTAASQNGFSSSATIVNLGTAGSSTSKLDQNRYVCAYSGPGVPTQGTCEANSSYTCTSRATAQANWTAAQKQNFANWYTYYRTRMQMAKATIGLAVKDIRGTPVSYTTDPTDGDYFHARVGYTNIYSATPKLAIAAFDSGSGSQKENFYSALYAATGTNDTPTRTALQRAGEMYQSKTGPIQYACQRNYSILMSDGYWNSSDPTIGNTDGDASRPQWDGASGGSGGSSNSMADVAELYYVTNLRPDLTPLDANGKPTYKLPAPSSSANLKIDDVAQWPHMTTYTIGLGINGICTYDPNYKAASHLLSSYISSFSKIYNDTGTNTAATCDGMWPIPVHDDPSAIDDLWHAAVDGRGTYFSAKSPALLAANLKQALNDMATTPGAGGAAGTGSLNPTPGGATPGKDYGYVASYTTGDWTGDLAAYTVTSSGQLSSTSAWSAAAKLSARLAAGTPARVIYTSLSGGTNLVAFDTGSFTTAAEQGWFDNTKLNQYVTWDSTQSSTATWQTMVAYLRGNSTYEQTGTTPLYRTRKGPIGDIVHSQAVFVGDPSFNFEDTGYAVFKAKSRAAAVYVGANDGMLHAFDATTGAENWAYVPPMVLPNLWRLADLTYASTHHYFVDGPIAVSDAYINGAWATVLVGALGAGGRGYYALDITSPTSPKLLWTFSADDDANVGYSFGTPLIAKVQTTQKAQDGTMSSVTKWAAILASGYNNVPEGSSYATADGGGYVFVRDLGDGSKIATISTGQGTATDPSGLATLNVQIKSSADYTVTAAYGGDLYGNMYRFGNLSADGTATELISLGTSQPITTAPEIGSISGTPIVYFGTGRYLGKSDMTNIDQQAIYAVKDDGTTTVTTSKLVKQTLSGGGVVSAQPVDWGTKFGWYVNLPNSGERVNIHPQFQLSTVVFATSIPPSTAADPCSQGGGSGWLYQFSYLTGGSVNSNSTIGTQLTDLPVGISLIGTGNLGGSQSADGKAIAQSGKGTATVVDIMKPSGSVTTGKATRVLWRELLK